MGARTQNIVSVYIPGSGLLGDARRMEGGGVGVKDFCDVGGEEVARWGVGWGRFELLVTADASC